ncbi:succinylglutamate desuccinylase [Marinobacter sp. X15-166B]|uniref:succinylglutamate desuccinylase n=1 Tax=Marinobacter sp. X15-166B TaxID=1897620 RepID=UPI00085C0121|nr:succinylglutamate desuccinylase [Marinobacter sp. X15-166B]OEY65585.1 succinylglutamate desuccinylase [Marinobacter sp. X15-166B]
MGGSARKALFGSHRHWLSHTLAHAQQPAPPGQTTLKDGTRLRLAATGVLEITPPQPHSTDPALIVSAGIHGNETAPIEVLNALVDELLRGAWQARRATLLLLGNPPAMVAGERFIEHNLNRLFAGAHQRAPFAGSAEARRAEALESVCRRFASGRSTLTHYDLHTAIRPSAREKFALYPFVAGRQLPDRQKAFLLEAGVNTVLLQNRAGTTFSSFTSSHLGAESLTIELGKVHPFGQNDLRRLGGIWQALRRLIGDQPAPPLPPGPTLTEFEVIHEIINTGPGFVLHIPDDAANFTSYPPGTLIWQDATERYRVGERPEAIVFPNRQVPVGQRAGLLVRVCR